MPSPLPAPRSSLLPASNRGSLLLVALLFAAGIAISLGSFLRVADQSTQLAYRSFYAGAAMNAAETGLEHSMWAVNKRNEGDREVWEHDDWNRLSTGAVRRTINLGTLTGGATSEVKLYVSSASLSGTPFVVARSIIRPPRGAPIERWIQITLSKRSRFSTGLVAKDTIRFSGTNASVDSYDSRLGPYNSLQSDGSRNKFARGSAGSASVSVNALTLGNADIWGNAVIGTSDLSGLSVGPNGTVGPFGTAAGTIVRDHVLTDFTAQFDDVAHPASYSGTGAYSITSIGGPTALPRVGDVPASDGKYYYNIGSISLSGAATNQLVIANQVVIRLTLATGTALNIGGNASVQINTAAGLLRPSLEIFTQADVKIAGNGVANANVPATFMLWGTRPQSASSAQSLAITGNGVLSSVVYAPNSTISMNGGGSAGNVFGSFIGKTVDVTGNSAFHYDEALADLDGGEPLGLEEWKEFITYADRRTFANLMNF